MATPTHSFDVIVVGASLAGCTAAMLLAREGARVALVERHARPESFKQLCTHYIQASALPVIKRLGLDRLIEQAGGVRNAAEIHTPHGWVGDHLGAQADGTPWYGYSIRRERLDPMLRELAASTPGVQLMAGLSAKSLIERDGRIVGITARGAAGEVSLAARLVVAADGRNSEMATLAGVKPRSAPNQRHSVLAAMRHVDLTRGHTALMWMTGPEVAYVFPNEDGITLMAWVAPKAVQADHSREQLLAMMKERIRSLPDGPQLREAELVGEAMAVKDYPCQWRPPVVKGMALVGDAATSLDYVYGVGCGWAFQSSAWLADAVAPALKEAAGADVANKAASKAMDQALRAYERQHHASLAAHRFFINDFAGRLSLNAVERLLYAAAAKDEGLARQLARVGARLDSPMRLMSPRILAKAIWVKLTRRAQPEGTRRSASMQVPSLIRPGWHAHE